MIICWDDETNPSARLATRAVHLEHIKTVTDRILIAGPFKNEAGGMIGSLFIIQAEDKSDAEAFVHADPYFKEGVWVKCQIEAFTPAAGLWSTASIM
jgi:uncharacterized protein